MLKILLAVFLALWWLMWGMAALAMVLKPPPNPAQDYLILGVSGLVTSILVVVIAWLKE